MTGHTMRTQKRVMDLHKNADHPRYHPLDRPHKKMKTFRSIDVDAGDAGYLLYTLYTHVYVRTCASRADVRGNNNPQSPAITRGTFCTLLRS